MWRNDSFEKTWCWKRLKSGGEGGEGDDRGWDGWMASPTQWTCVWVDSSSWWWTGRPGVLQSMGSQRVRHDWATELNWTEPFKDIIDGEQRAPVKGPYNYFHCKIQRFFSEWEGTLSTFLVFLAMVSKHSKFCPPLFREATDKWHLLDTFLYCLAMLSNTIPTTLMWLWWI